MLTLPKKNHFTLTVVALAFGSLLGCSSGGGNGGGNSGGEVDSTVTEDTDLVIQNTTRTISSNIGVNMNSIEATAENSSAVDNLLADDVTAEQVTSGQPFDDGQPVGYVELAREVVAPTLEGGNATRTRTGNVINIDPDERYVCQQWSNDDVIDSVDLEDCVALLSEVTVRINASSDDSGTLSYLFNEQNLLRVEYAPTAGSYELFLPAVKLVLQRSATINGESGFIPEVLEGALKLSTTLISDAAGAESGSMSLAVSQPLQVVSSADDINLQLGNTSGFSIESDVASGNGKLSVKLNAMKLSMLDLVGTDPNAIADISVPDFSLIAQLQDGGDEILLTDTGFGSAPMTVSINDQLVMSLALAKTSLLFSGEDSIVTFLGNVAFNLNVPNLSELTDGDYEVNSTATLSVSTTAGTELRQQPNDSTKVERGGPFNVDYSLIDGITNSEGSMSFVAGECFDGTSDDLEVVRVSCD